MNNIVFKIYLTGLNVRNRELVANFREACEQSMTNGAFDISVVDIMKDSSIADKKKILACPTIIREKPLPEKRVIGDFRDLAKAKQAVTFLMSDISAKF